MELLGLLLAKAGCGSTPGRATSTSGGFLLPTYCTDNKSAVKACVKTFFPYNMGMSTNRMGRPPKPPAERQAARLEIRMTEAELTLIERAAGGKTSTWARQVLVRAARRRDK